MNAMAGKFWRANYQRAAAAIIFLWCGLYLFRMLSPHFSRFAYSIGGGDALLFAVYNFPSYLLFFIPVTAVPCWYFSRDIETGLINGMLLGCLSLATLSLVNIIEEAVFGRTLVDVREIDLWLVVMGVFGLCGYVSAVRERVSWRAAFWTSN